MFWDVGPHPSISPCLGCGLHPWLRVGYMERIGS